MIEVEGLGKIYRKGFWKRPQLAVQDLRFAVSTGEVFGLVGPNGAGKSTLIKILLGLLAPSAGNARLFGVDSQLPESRRGVGYLPELPQYYSYLTGAELLKYFAGLSGLAGVKAVKSIKSCCQRVGIEDSWLDKKIGSYSKGMVQRLGLAQSLLGNPRLLILDEPTSGLDPVGRRDFRMLIKEIKSEGISVFYSSHVLSDVEELCDRVGVLAGGVLKTIVSVPEVLAEGSSNLEDILLKEFS